MVLTVPYHFSHKRSLEFIDKHKDWINTQIEKLKLQDEKIKKLFEQHSGKILLFGEWKEIKTDNLENFYKNEALTFFTQKSKFFADLLKVKFNKILIKNQKTLWGSCSLRSSTLSYNYNLIKAPSFVGEYIAIHEVAHLLHPNHSRDFYKTVDNHFSKRLEAQNYLKNNSKVLRENAKL